jgi:hypothetical protein
MVSLLFLLRSSKEDYSLQVWLLQSLYGLATSSASHMTKLAEQNGIIVELL